MKHLNIEVFGKVQGVYYRLTCKAVADQLGIKGYVMNRPDGSVYLEAEGDEFGLESLLEFCAEGPERAEVAEIKTGEGPMQYFKNFEVVKKIKER